MCGNGRGRGQAQSEVGGRARDVNINTRYGGRRYASQSTAHQPTLRMTRVVSRHRGFTPSCRVARYALSRFAPGRGCARYKGKRWPYSTAERTVPELIPVLAVSLQVTES